MENTSPLTLLETINAKHLGLVRGSSTLYTKFSVLKLSGAIAIASTESKPTMSIIYPGTDKPPTILDTNNMYMPTLFLMICNQEYLAAASEGKIQLRNLGKKTSTVAYTFKESAHWCLCVVDERTVACVQESTSPIESFSQICLLNTDTEKFDLSSAIRIKADEVMTDMCYMKTTDGTACLLLSFPLNKLVQCVEMVGRLTNSRWGDRSTPGVSVQMTPSSLLLIPLRENCTCFQQRIALPLPPSVFIHLAFAFQAVFACRENMCMLATRTRTKTLTVLVSSLNQLHFRAVT